MKVGQYVSMGKTYRWVGNLAGGYAHEVNFYGGGWTRIDVFDWPEARKALDELIEEHSGPWVELPSLFPLRVSKDGIGEQVKRDGRWSASRGISVLTLCYRKGREVVIEEVQELTGLILSLDGSYQWNEPTGYLKGITKLDWRDIVDRAKGLRK
jgi:hypothetical protein